MAQVLPDSLTSAARYSILVAEPSSANVYTMYGHAGIRIQDSVQGIDVTFNYGIFNFSDNFIPRFIRGETDYIVLPQWTGSYMNEYLSRGSNVTEVVLKMEYHALMKAWKYLLWNIQPENRTYRYNFFYDNCSTRPIDIYLSSIGDEGLYTIPHDSLSSWRVRINELEASDPWLVLGTDLALGSETDAIMTAKEERFLPHRLAEMLKFGQLRRSDGQSIVETVREYKYYSLDRTSDSTWRTLIHPTVLVGILLLLSMGDLIRVRLGWRPFRWFRHMLFCVVGFGGGILCYIAFFSAHPHRLPNYNLWVVHPLHLLVPFLTVIPCLRKGERIYHFVNFVAQCSFLAAAYFLPQTFNMAFFMLSMVLAILSLTYIMDCNRKLGFCSR